MTPKQPPRIATWMLKHFGSGANNDAVLGDLAEQYQQRGRDVVLASGVGSYSDKPLTTQSQGMTPISFNPESDSTAGAPGSVSSCPGKPRQ